MIRRGFAALALCLLTASCATDTEDPPAAASPEETAEVTEAPATDTVEVALGEWSVLPDPEAVQADEITFEVSNSGKEEHEFAIVKTDLEADNLPTKDDGSVDEEELDVLGEVEDLAAGENGQVTVDLDAGSYVLMCNLVHTSDEHDDHAEPEVHYKLGMRTPFEVS